MKIFQPDLIVKNVTMITTELLKKHHVKALILDVDNTLTTHGNPEPGEGVMQWVRDNAAGGYSDDDCVK